MTAAVEVWSLGEVEGGGGGDALDAVDTDLVAEGGPGDGGGDAETVGGAGVAGGCGSGRSSRRRGRTT